VDYDPHPVCNEVARLMPKEKGNRSQSVGLATVPSSGYRELLTDIKARIRVAQIKASLSVNRELIQLYGTLGD
jgi:hypothetical protein